jgi:6,7-dimethyl-8-ribityllumazine synthase
MGRFALVAARFNALVVDRLIEGAQDALRRHGVADADIDLVRVPGSLEIPVVVHRLCQAHYAAIIAIGAVIRGETSHYDVVVQQSAGAISRIAIDTGIPVLNAILTTETLEQAMDRAGGKAGNKGFDAALAAIEMANLLASLPVSDSST